MPELSNIQTYEKLSGGDFKPTLEKFAQILRHIELWNEEIQKAFDDFEWKVDGDGLVYSSITEVGQYETKFSDIKVRPLVMAYTPALGQTFDSNWIACDLLVDAGELRDFKTGNYYSHTYPFIRSLVTEMATVFDQTGVYFTDETQDGEDFDGIRTLKQDKLWQFDYALIPNSLKSIYKSTPETHHLTQHEKHFETWYAERWKGE
jgi:hypothetical protein